MAGNQHERQAPLHVDIPTRTSHLTMSMPKNSHKTIGEPPDRAAVRPRMVKVAIRVPLSVFKIVKTSRGPTYQGGRYAADEARGEQDMPAWFSAIMRGTNADAVDRTHRLTRIDYSPSAWCWTATAT